MSGIYRQKIFDLINMERQRQEELHPGVENIEKLFIALSEEVGEVANAILEHNGTDDATDHLLEEVIQVASLGVRMAEFLAEEDCVLGFILKPSGDVDK